MFFGASHCRPPPPPTFAARCTLSARANPSEKRIIRVAGYAVLCGLLLIIGTLDAMHAGACAILGWRSIAKGSSDRCAVNPILAGGNDV